MRKFLSNVLYLFLGLPLTLSALMLISVRPWVLDRDFYKRAVTDDRLYAALRAAQPSPEAPRLARRGDASYDTSALSVAVRKNLPEAELKALGARAVDQAMDLVLGADRDGKFDLDLRPIKAAIAARGPALARDYVAALPSRPELPAPGDFSYRPASLSPKEAETKAAAALRRELGAMPDAVAAPVDARVVERDGARVFLSRALLDRMTATTTALSALLLAALAAIGGSGIAGRIAKAGRLLIAPSVVAIALGVLLWLPGAAFLERALPAEARALLAGPATAAFRAYAASVLGGVARGFFLTGLVGASLGGLLASTRRIAEPKELE